MHLYPIIYQDPSAKLAGLSKVTSRPSLLLQIEANVDVLRIRLAVSGWPSSYCLLTAPLGGFLVELELTPLAPPPPIWKGVDLQVVF